MKTYPVTIPEMALVAVTRGIGGAGLGLLLGGFMDLPTRRTLGWTLLGIGVVSTLPILLALTASRSDPAQEAAVGTLTERALVQ